MSLKVPTDPEAAAQIERAWPGIQANIDWLNNPDTVTRMSDEELGRRIRPLLEKWRAE